MSILSRLFGASPEARSADHVSFQSVFGRAPLGAGSGTAAGKAVTSASALQVSAVYASVRILSDSVATLPLDSFLRSEGVRRPYRPRPRWLDFTEGPFPKVDILSQVMTSLLLDGNAYLATYRDPTGLVLWVEVLDPAQVEPVRSGSEVRFRVGGSQTTVGRYDVLHIRGMTLAGHIKGCSPVHYARETIGLSAAATEYGATFFGNGALPGMVAEVPGTLSPAGIKALKDGWNEAHQGAGNAHRLAVLTEGASFSKVTVAPNDAQFLETRKFQVNDVARIYGVPTSLLQHADGPEMGQSIQDKNTHFVQHSLRPWVERVEAALSWLIVSEGLNPRAFVKINLDGLLRGDYSTRWATYGASVRDGLVTINEVRAWEDLPPVPWGDEPISVQVQADPAATSLLQEPTS